MYSGPSFVKSYEVSLFIGSFNNETHENFTKDDLIERIAEFQNDPRIALCEEDDDLTSVKHPVRVTDTEFVSGHDYRELGWQVTAIQYPRLTSDESEIWRWMCCLAYYLKEEFKQHRICVQDASKVVMYGE